MIKATKPTAEDNRGLRCRHCGCLYFYVIYTRAAWGRKACPPAGVPSLRKAGHNLRANHRLNAVWHNLLVGKVLRG